MTPRKRRQYKSGSLYQRKSDGRWFGAYDDGFNRDGSRRRRTVSAKTKPEARRKLEKALREKDAGREASARTTVRTWAETWLDMTAKTVTPNAHTTDRSATGWIVEAIGHRRLDELTPADRRAVRDAITSAGNSTSTALRYDGTLVRMLKAAIVEGHAVPSRVLAAKGPSAAVNDRSSIPTIEAMACLAVASELPHGTRWVAALLQGMRQGECLGLPWENVKDDRLTLSWQLQPLPYRVPRDRASGFRVPDGYEARQLVGQMHLVRPKSKAGWRVMPLLPFMAEGLERWRAMSPPSPHGLVWPAADGSPASETDDRDEWRAIQGAAGVGHPAGRYYKLHEARHGLATVLMELGVAESVRIAIMGHSSITVTQGYEHVDMAELTKAMQKVATRFELA